MNPNPIMEPMDTQAASNSDGALVPDQTEGYLLAERACWHLLEKMAEDVVVLDLRGRSDVCDFFVIASGNSDVQVRALAKHAHNVLIEAGHRPQGLEGMNEGRWALLDFFDVVLHIFGERTRGYFQLERLWCDAPRLDVGPEWFADDAVRARHPDLKFPPAAAPPEAE